MQRTNWAILLCKFSDNASEPHTRNFYERLFTSAGAGSSNMSDFFHDVSHGFVDVGGSRICGWFTLNQQRSDYTGSGVNPAGRQALVDWAKQKATDSGIDLTPFFGVVVSMNVSTDLFGGARQVVCDPGSLQPSILGQEMGHGYGLDHSRTDGSVADYTDRWDVMSTWDSCFMAPHPEWTSVGPGLNAWNMRARGWLDESRVWKAPPGDFDANLQLRPLHRTDLSGLLAAEVPGGLLIEFRTREGWDAAIPRSAVLLHRFAGNHSYIMRNSRGDQEFVVGDVYERGNPALFWLEGWLRLTVTAIDSATRTATVSLRRRHGLRMPEFAQMLGGVSVDGGGWVIVGGRKVPVPPWSPLLQVLEEVAAFESAATSPSVERASAIRRASLESIAEHVTTELSGVPHLNTPAPRTREQG